MTINLDTTYLDANDAGTPTVAGSGTYGPLRLRTLANTILNMGALADTTMTAPPGVPVEGVSYYVPAGGTGAWAGQDGNIATYVNGGWVFSPATGGMTFYDQANGKAYISTVTGLLEIGAAAAAADIEVLHDTVADATAAEAGALTVNETVLVELADGTLRQVAIGDLPIAGGAGGTTEVGDGTSIDGAGTGADPFKIAGVDTATNGQIPEADGAGGINWIANPNVVHTIGADWVNSGTAAVLPTFTLPAAPAGQTNGYWAGELTVKVDPGGNPTVTNGTAFVGAHTAVHGTANTMTTRAIMGAPGNNVNITHGSNGQTTEWLLHWHPL